MTKHLYKPFNSSFYNGVEKLDNYKCVYCGKVYNASIDITRLQQSNAFCRESNNVSSYEENKNKLYDCSTFNTGWSYKIYNIKNSIKYCYFKVGELCRYIMSLGIK